MLARTAAEAMFEQYTAKKDVYSEFKRNLEKIWEREKEKALASAKEKLSADYEFEWVDKHGISQQEVYTLLPAELAEMHKRGKVWVWRPAGASKYTLRVRGEQRKDDILEELHEAHKRKLDTEAEEEEKRQRMMQMPMMPTMEEAGSMPDV